MLEQLLLYIKKNKLFEPKERILLAVSGGMDSVVMAELFHKAKFKFAIAHCNFQLRGKESDGDEKFVKTLAKKYGVEFFSRHFDTRQVAEEKKISIQMAARDLRYEWFKSIIKNEKYRYVATAHHLNDSIETFFINLFRGTGIEGLKGIKAKNGNVIRPLLFASRSDIEKFAIDNKIRFREDSSNLKDDYLRNKIRHRLIPVLKDINPAFDKIMSENLKHFAFAEAVINDYRNSKSLHLFNVDARFPYINIAEVKKEEYPEQVLFLILSKYGFNFSQCQEMLNEDSETPSGKVFSSVDFRLLRDRGKLLLDLNCFKDDDEYTLTEKTKMLDTHQGELKISFIKSRKNLVSTHSIQCLDASLLRFPLIMRRWKGGDYFYPLGMKHRKKLSDFFIDQKINLFEKENAYVLTSENKIICILGHRIDERFKITDKTKKIYKLEFTNY